MDNWQEQVQELQALGAIYGEDFCIPGIISAKPEADCAEEFMRLAQAKPPSLGIEAHLLIKIIPAAAPVTVQV